MPSNIHASQAICHANLALTDSLTRSVAVSEDKLVTDFTCCDRENSVNNDPNLNMDK